MSGYLKVGLQTVTPLHIGNGETLSPYSDYVFDEKSGKIYILDQQKVENALNQLEHAQDVIDEFVSRLITNNNMNNSYSIKHFFEEYGINYKELARTIIETNANIKAEEIQECIKSGVRPYIPGSSIKGAVRTALLYVHRKEDGYSIDDAVRDVFGDKKRKYKKSPNGEDLFGQFDQDIMKFLHISDTNPITSDDIGIAKTFRFDLKNNTTTIPITKEVIKENKTFEFRLQCKAIRGFHNINHRYSYLYENGNHQGEHTILQMVNQFSIHLIEREWKTLKKMNISELKPITNLYEKLYTSAEQFRKNQNGALIRLGSGKTFFDNTISTLFSEDDLKVLRKRIKLGTGQPFPKTRLLLENGNMYDSILGWVYLYSVKE